MYKTVYCGTCFEGPVKFTIENGIKWGGRNVKAKYFQKEMTLKVASQARWPYKTVTVNDSFYSTKFKETKFFCRRLDSKMTLMKGCMKRAQLQLTRFQWLHEDMFTRLGRPPSERASPSRVSLMAELSKVCSLNWANHLVSVLIHLGSH